MNRIIPTIVIVLAALVLASCATPINWQARMGVYTFDQAVTDYGPPDKSAKLSDGSTVAEWVTERSEYIVTQQPYIYGPGYYGPIWTGYSTTYFPAHFLRLTFSTDGRLKAWKQFSK